MPGAPDPADIARWQRFFAVECNNRAWDLASQSIRTPEEADEMLYAAYAAAYHWKFAGQGVNHARADVTLAHVHSLLGQGERALHYARRSVDYFHAQPAADWDFAFAHLEVAFAAAVAGNSLLHSEYYSLARMLGESIVEEEDRKIFLDEFARIPAP